MKEDSQRSPKTGPEERDGSVSESCPRVDKKKKKEIWSEPPTVTRGGEVVDVGVNPRRPVGPQRTRRTRRGDLWCKSGKLINPNTRIEVSV